MATNQIHDHGNQMSVACTQPATPASGDPVLYGQRPGVALTDENTDGLTTVKFNGVYDLSVKGEDGAGNAAIAKGDILYYDTAAAVKINKDATNGVRYGYANEAVASGATSTIEVIIGY